MWKQPMFDYQCGHRQERSTVDQIFTVRQILKKCSEHGKDTRHLFIDFKAAYDSIDRRRLYAAMEKLNIPQKLIALVKATMNNTHCRVKIENRFSEPINVKNGARQGDALACLLFNIALEKVIRDAAVNIRGTTFYKSIQILAYVVDIDIIGRTQSAMIEAFTSLEKAAKDMNLFINQEKTKYMPVTKKSHENYPHHLEVGSYKFQVIHGFTYLGSDVNCNNDISEEIQKRILAANRCFYGLRKHLRSHLTSKKH
jgi:sorting nexin-29